MGEHIQAIYSGKLSALYLLKHFSVSKLAKLEARDTFPVG